MGNLLGGIKNLGKKLNNKGYTKEREKSRSGKEGRGQKGGKKNMLK